MASDADFFAKARGNLIEGIVARQETASSTQRLLDRDHPLAAFIDVLGNGDFLRWYETEFVDFIENPENTSLDDVVEWLESKLRG